MAQSVYEELIRRFIEAKIPSPRLEARLLIAAAAGTDADNISSDTVLSDDAKKRLEKMAEERERDLRRANENRNADTKSIE